MKGLIDDPINHKDPEDAHVECPIQRRPRLGNTQSRALRQTFVVVVVARPRVAVHKGHNGLVGIPKHGSMDPSKCDGDRNGKCGDQEEIEEKEDGKFEEEDSLGGGVESAP